MNNTALERSFMEVGVLPKDITGAAQTGACVSMKNYRRLYIYIVQGAWAGGTSAVTLEQCTAVDGTDAKELAFDYRYTKLAAGSAYTKTAVTSNTFDLDTANTINVIEVKAEDLDVANNFDCVRVKADTPGANADLLAIIYHLDGARYSQAAMPDPNTD